MDISKMDSTTETEQTITASCEDIPLVYSERQCSPSGLFTSSKYSYRPLRARCRLSRGSRSSSKPYSSVPHDQRRLLHACATGDTDHVNRILQDSPDISVQISDYRGRTPLHFSCAKGCDAIVRLLLERGADPSCKDINGNTPLHLACCGSHIRVVTMLLYHGASPSSRDFLGRTPIELALARLKLISYSLESTKEKKSSTKLTADVTDIVALLRECSKNKTNSLHNQLNAICDDLEAASISLTPEATDVNKLLSGLEALQLNLSE